MSKLATIIGVLLGLVIIGLNMIDYEQGRLLTAFFNWQGLLVVLGGTLAATLINYPLSQVNCVWHGLGRIFTAEPDRVEPAIEQIVTLSYLAHRKGPLALENELDLIDDEFLRFAVSEMMVYQDVPQLEASLENHLNTSQLRHLNCQEMFYNMAAYAPAFGMMGTVMGLIMMMTTHVGGAQNGIGPGDDMLQGLLQGMGLALVTTFYGVLLANLAFTPIAGKLKVLSDAEALKNDILMYGILGIKKNVAPLLLKESLMAFVNNKNKQRLMDQTSGLSG
ncbi:MAG: MotA/TolQ/ExbB proton channel family protein [Hydrogenovibrio sp.]|uniref:motility protein A n=1 Tax=Hydrogenovibrio sp. TaxID=2065821 RepID=UPI00286FCE96|nr:MotA/TolQ/ExbB proton channel family protein [Hydrogenovibrio sp.]MDR9498863.1 MotA/TolQ/ExbB proton channel family protein [Hydrogenovibrio sp.]